MKKFFFLFILLAVFLEVIADILFKKWSFSGRNVLLAIGIFLYTIGTIAWAYSLKFESLSKAVSVFTILNFILVILAGLVIFGEELSSVNKIGIFLGLVSVILLEL